MLTLLWYHESMPKIETDDMTTTTMRIQRELLDQLKECARLHDRSLAAECRVALAAHARRYLKKHEEEQ